MILLYSDTASPRLRYIVDFFSEELFDEPIRITHNKNFFLDYSDPKLNYSSTDFSESEFFLKSHAILFENDIRQQDLECFELNFQKAFFATKGDYPFDIFAASFFLLTRYEEYLPHQKDSFGRYDHQCSLAFREGFLHLPLVNIWLEDFKKALIRKFPGLSFKHHSFKCLLTYDIDIAYSYRHKGFMRNIGGFGRSMLKGKWNEVKERWSVVNGKEKDPFDCFEWLDALHLYCRIKPYYFFLVAKKAGVYDKNVSITASPFQELIKYCSGNYKVGVHPSWQSSEDKYLVKEEKEWLEMIIEKPVKYCRQHYIRLTLPETYRNFIEAGIDREFSMGYGSINGFRASICSTYNWFDLAEGKATGLLLYPFCFMDANSYFEQQQKPHETYRELMQYYNIVKKYQGLFISIWHNHMLASNEQFSEMRKMFELFMRETVYWDAYLGEDSSR